VFKAPASASMPLRLFVEGKEGITFNPFWTKLCVLLL
jgi:hypothetical protein